MRLLNTTTLESVYYADNEVPNYAILSHTWGIDEVTLEDLKGGSIEQKAGYHKIKHASDIAAQNGFSLIWIDTCCIDKSSSAELSEAINSMYRYYQDANVCYAYLADVPYEPHITDDSHFLASKWFSRGWTLQELIAPKDLIFFSTDWRAIGTKQTLAAEISQITGVDREVLADATHLEEISVANRMSWHQIGQLLVKRILRTAC